MFSSLIVRVRYMRIPRRHTRDEERFDKQFRVTQMHLDLFFASHGESIDPASRLSIFIPKRIIIEKSPRIIISTRREL